MDPADAIRHAREQAKMSKRELARRAGTSPAAIVFYESGTREPSYSTLSRLAAAAGFDARLSLVPKMTPAPDVLGRRLTEVLDLAEHLPHRRASRRLAYPPLGSGLASARHR
jgi:transcriptional regulator with XRE-family HTH domain